MICNKYVLIILFFVFLFFSCSSPSFTSEELNIIQIANKVIIEDDERIEKQFNEAKSRIYEAVYDRGSRPKEIKVLRDIETALIKADHLNLVYEKVENDILNSKTLNEGIINAMGDSIYICQKEFRNRVESDLNSSLKDFPVYPDSNYLFKQEAPLSFYSAYFKSIPRELLLFRINLLKNDLLSRKKELLYHYAAQIGSLDYICTRILPFISPRSEIIDSDSIYHADVFLFSTEDVEFDVIYDGEKLDCIPSGENGCWGYRDLKFPAPKPDHYDSNGLSKQQWTATVALKKGMEDSLITITKDYYIRKPCK